MKQKLLLGFLLCIPFFLFSQTKKDSTQYYKRILQVDTFSIDQKKVILKKAIDYSQRIADRSATIDYKIRYAEILFNLGQYRLVVEDLVQVISELEQILKKPMTDFKVKKQWQDLHIEALSQLGRAEVYVGISEEAMLSFNKIMELYGEEGNSMGAGKAYHGMGIVFGVRNNWVTALEYYQKSLKIYQKNNYLRGQYMMYSNIGGTYCGMQNYTEALNSFVEMHRIVLAEKYTGNELVYTNLNLALAYEGLQKYELAEKYYIEALAVAEQKKLYHLRMYVRSSYAVALYDQGFYAKAKKINDLLLIEALELKALSMQRTTLRMSSQIFEKQGKYKEANELLRQSYVILDSMMSQQSEERVLTIKYQFDNYKIGQEKKLKEKNFELAEEKLANRNLWLAFLLVLSIIAGIVIVVMTRRILYQCRVNNLMKERLVEAKEGEGVRFQGMKEHFVQQLDSKNKELTSNALLFLKFNELAINLMDKVKDLKIHFTLKSKEKQIVNDMESLLKEFSPNKDWAEFKMYFEQVNSEFFPKLEAAYPDLTPNEMRLCALIRLNLTAKEIASLTNRTFQSVGTAKFRLKKKMNLSQEANLYEVFLKL